MLMTLKNRQVLDLAEGIVRIDKMSIENSSAIFNYTLIMNEDAVRTKAEAIIGMQVPSKDYMKYEEDRISIVDKYSDKDEDDKVITVDSNPNWVKVADDKTSDFNLEISKLAKTYKDTLDKRNKDLEDFKNVLDDEVEMDIEIVKLADIPAEVGRDRQLMRFIMTMIKKI